MMRVAVIGNCQADLFAGLIRAGSAAETVTFRPNYELQASDAAPILEQLSNVDVVFAQRVSSTYGVDWLRPASLRSTVGDNVFIWPNVYFDGYYPDVQYLYGPTGKITGPLDDYHFASVLRQGANAASADDLPLPVVGDPNSAFEASLQNLFRREADCDVSISSYVAAHAHRSLAFYTPNHPATFIMRELVRRSMHVANVDFDVELSRSYTWELDNVIIRPHDPIIATFGLAWTVHVPYRGLVPDGSGGFQLGSRHEWMQADLFRSFRNLYSSLFEGDSQQPDASDTSGPALR